MILEILIFIVTTILAYFLYDYRKVQKKWIESGVKFVKPYPIFGNNIKSTFSKRHMWHDVDAVYRAFPDERYIGYFDGPLPSILIRDPELIKAVTVKDFDYFTDHRPFFSDPIFNESVFIMRGETWRDMRTTLSPAFTGSKMKQMVPLMNETSNNAVEYLKEIEGQVIDVGDVIRRYTNDVIASTSFGLQVNSFKDIKNDFFVTGQVLLKLSFMQKIKMFLSNMFPGRSKLLAVFSEETANFFYNLVRNTVEYRERNKIERADMIQLLMEASKGTLKLVNDSEEDNIGFATTEEISLKREGTKKPGWTQEQMAAQAFIFFFAGFENTASVLVMTIHELALNKKIQEKLYNEVEKQHKTSQLLTYEAIQNMKYLDCVITETFRKWSPAVRLDRVCVKPYLLPSPKEGGEPYQVNPGDSVYCSVNSLHMDEKYYENPTLFDPERFSDENKDKVTPFTFMPFGTGPRNCIGSRLALLELKILLYHIVLNFEILKCEETQDPLELETNDFSIKAKGGTYVKMRQRK